MRIAIVGTGKVAARNYIPVLAGQPDVRLTLYNRTRSRAEACAAGCGARVADSIGDLMEEGPDAVFLLTREMDRYDAASAILEHRPKRLFFEKPLVAVADQAHVTEEDFTRGRELILRAREVGCETAMIFNYRFFEQSLRAARILSERPFGRPTQVTALAHFACWSHCIDLIHRFAGPLDRIAALPGPREQEGAGLRATDLSGAFVTESGATGTILGTCGIHFGFPLFEMLFGFEGGRFTLRDLDGDMEVIDYAGDGHQVFALARQNSRWDHYGRSFEKSILAYLESVRHGLPPPVPGLAGLQELQFEAALRRSVRQNRPIRVREEFPLP
jgi:predicted dehydrogenase